MDKQPGTDSSRNDGLVTRRTVLGGLVTAALTTKLVTDDVPAEAKDHDKGAGAEMSTVGLPMPRAFHTVTELHNKRLLVAGGVGPGNRALSSVLIYDLERETWTEAGSMNMARYQHAAVQLNDGRVLVTGGLNRKASPMFGAEIYSPHTDSWAAAPALIMARYGHTLSALADGRVLVAGGVLAGLLSGMEYYSIGKV